MYGIMMWYSNHTLHSTSHDLFGSVSIVEKGRGRGENSFGKRVGGEEGRNGTPP